MKKTVFLSLVAMVFCFSIFALCVPTEENFSYDLKIVRIDDLTDDTLNEIIQGNHPDIAIEIPAHTVLPISLIYGFERPTKSLKDRLQTEKTIETDQICYLRYVQGQVLESEDLTDWKSTVDLFWEGFCRALKTELINLSIPD